MNREDGWIGMPNALGAWARPNFALELKLKCDIFSTNLVGYSGKEIGVATRNAYF